MTAAPAPALQAQPHPQPPSCPWRIGVTLSCSCCSDGGPGGRGGGAGPGRRVLSSGAEGGVSEAVRLRVCGLRAARGWVYVWNGGTWGPRVRGAERSPLRAGPLINRGGYWGVSWGPPIRLGAGEVRLYADSGVLKPGCSLTPTGEEPPFTCRLRGHGLQGHGLQGHGLLGPGLCLPSLSPPPSAAGTPELGGPPGPF